mgnify:FL=1
MTGLSGWQTILQRLGGSRGNFGLLPDKGEPMPVMDAESAKDGDRLSIVEAHEAREIAGFDTALAARQIWKHSAQGLPRREDIDPVSFGYKLLPYLVMLEVDWANADYHWRFSGEKAAVLYGRQITRRSLRDIEREFGHSVSLRPVLDSVVGARKPVFFRCWQNWPLGKPAITYGVMMPLIASDGQEQRSPVERILGALKCVREDGSL